MSDDYLRKMSLPEFRKQYEGTFAEPEPMTEDELLQMERRHERRDDDAQRVIREVWRLRADLAAAEQRATESEQRAERLAAAITKYRHALSERVAAESYERPIIDRQEGALNAEERKIVFHAAVAHANEYEARDELWASISAPATQPDERAAAERAPTPSVVP